MAQFYLYRNQRVICKINPRPRLYTYAPKVEWYHLQFISPFCWCENQIYSIYPWIFLLYPLPTSRYKFPCDLGWRALLKIFVSVIRQNHATFCRTVTITFEGICLIFEILHGATSRPSFFISYF